MVTGLGAAGLGLTVASAYALRALVGQRMGISGLQPAPYTRPARYHVDLAVPAYQEERYLPLLLLTARHQSEPFAHLLVADASEDGETQTAAEAEGARVVRAEFGNISRSRNLAARACNGEIVVFADSDLLLPWNFVEQATNALEDGFVAAHPREAIYDSTRWLLSEYLVTGLFRASWNTTRCMAVRREAYEAVGGYNEGCSPLPGKNCREDMEFGLRLRTKYGGGCISVLSTHIGVSSRRERAGEAHWPWSIWGVR